MATREMTFEEIDQLVQKMNVGATKAMALEGLAPGDILGKLCPLWKVIGPILKIVVKLLPGTWRTVIESFIAIMDSVCKS